MKTPRGPITGADYRILTALGKLGADDPGRWSSARIARLCPEAPGRCKAADRLANAGFLVASDVKWGQGTRTVYARTAKPIPATLSPWVILLPPPSLGDPLQLASGYAMRAGTSSDDMALHFEDEVTASSYLELSRGRYAGFNPRVANFDRLTL